VRHADVTRIGLCHVLSRKSVSGATIRNGQQCGETKCRRKGRLAMVRSDTRGIRSLPLYPAELRAHMIDNQGLTGIASPSHFSVLHRGYHTQPLRPSFPVADFRPVAHDTPLGV
jgi:hypothetical protein